MTRRRLALVTIARDEARCIERCLASVASHVDAMLVYDTGSRDDTVARAVRAGATVRQGDWPGDFAAARNAALDAAGVVDPDWVLVLDADEWLSGGTETLTALRTEAPAFLGVVTVVNLFGVEMASAAESPSWIPRLLPRGVRYEGRIHEQPRSSWPRRRLALRVHHDGYLDPVLRGKGERNRRLLAQALAEQPDDAYLHYQAGKDFELAGEHPRALLHYERAFAGCDAAAVWRHDLVLRAIYTAKKCGRFEQALGWVRDEGARFAESPDLWFAHGDLLLDWAASDPARALRLVPMIEAAWQRALAIGERPELPDSVRGRGSWLAAHNLAVLHEGLGRAEQAQAWRERAAQLRAAAASSTRG